MNILEAITLVENYIKARKGVTVNINPLKVASSMREMMLLEQATIVAIEYFNKEKIIIS